MNNKVVFKENNLSSTMLFASIIIFLLWYIQYYWKRRPLYKFAAQRPGPPSLPVIGCILEFIGPSKDFFNKWLTKMSKYESPAVVWLGQKLLLNISRPEDLEIILNSQHALEREEAYKFAIPLLGLGLITAPVPKWRVHRKIINPTFNQKILDGYVEVFLEQSVILLNQLKQEAGKGMFDAHKYLNRSSMDMICETAMDIKVNAQSTDSVVLDLYVDVLKIVWKRTYKIWYQFDFIFNLTSLGKKQNYFVKHYRKFTDDVIDKTTMAYQKRNEEVQRQPEEFVDGDIPLKQSFLQRLIQLTDEGIKFTHAELRNEVQTFIAAGTETTANTESFVFIMLGMFPNIQENVYKEIIDVLGSEKVVEYTDLRRLEYTERVIKETLRLFPIFPILGRTATGDIKLKSCVVPAGCTLILDISCLHRNGDIWPDPLKFDPDRFLPEEVAKRHPYSYLAFSAGPRNCIGMKYAMMAMKTVIAMVVRKYRITTSYTSIEDIKLQLNIAISPIGGHLIGLEPRP